MRILLADDHAIIRSAFKFLLIHPFKVLEFGEAEDCQQAIDTAIAQPWDLVILDISMPGGGGLHALKKIRSKRPSIPVLMVSMHEEPLIVMNAIHLGANGYLSKVSACDELIHAVTSIRKGARYLSRAMTEQLVAAQCLTEFPFIHERLSKRELEILRQLAANRTAREIADALHLSINTINTYRRRVLKKMQMRTNADLVRYTFNHALVA